MFHAQSPIAAKRRLVRIQDLGVKIVATHVYRLDSNDHSNSLIESGAQNRPTTFSLSLKLDNFDIPHDRATPISLSPRFRSLTLHLFPNLLIYLPFVIPQRRRNSMTTLPQSLSSIPTQIT